MKRALVATALSLSLTAPAFADSIAVVDFDNDGVISSRDYIGPKENLEMKPTVQPAKFRTVTSEKTVEVEGATPIAKTIDEVAVPKDFDSTNYRHIGELPAAPLKPMEMAEAKTKTVTTTRRVLVSPAMNTATTATVYGSPHGSERQVVSSELQGQIMKPQEGADGVLTASELGVQDEEFRRLALAEYDTNKDGTVTVEEAVANVDPLIDPNDAAVRHSVFSATTAINSGDSNGR